MNMKGIKEGTLEILGVFASAVVEGMEREKYNELSKKPMGEMTMEDIKTYQKLDEKFSN